MENIMKYKTPEERKNEQTGVLLMVIVCIAVWSAIIVLVDGLLP